MGLATSGIMSLGGSTAGRSVNLELKRAAGAAASMNGTAERKLAGKTSGIIKMSDFYGKSSGQLLKWTLAPNSNDYFWYKRTGVGEYDAATGTLTPDTFKSPNGTTFAVDSSQGDGCTPYIYFNVTAASIPLSQAPTINGIAPIDIYGGNRIVYPSNFGLVGASADLVLTW